MGERMTPARVLAAAGLALVFLTSASVALAAGRVALVVGNSTYSHIARLPNPENDAVDMAATLRRLGFDVTTAQDADRASLNEALRVFTRESVGADVALVFYAGHGLEMDGVNYLVPVDARLERDTDVRFETVALDDVLAANGGGVAADGDPGRVPEQPPGAVDAADGGSSERERGQLRGPERGSAGGRDARGVCRGGGHDGGGWSGPEQPVHVGPAGLSGGAPGAECGVPAGSRAVLESTDGQQRPHEYGSLLREHYLSGVSGPAPVAVAAADGAAARLQQETVFWQSIMGSTNATDFEAYLGQFPDGVYRALAANRLAELRPAPDDPDGPRPAEPGSVFRDCESCPEMVVVPAGGFRMGCVSDATARTTNGRCTRWRWRRSRCRSTR